MHMPSLVCADAEALVRAALAPWSPSTHYVQTATFRCAVRTVLCAGARLAALAARYDGGDDDDETTMRPLPCLPVELWHAILRCCTRDWWNTS